MPEQQSPWKQFNGPNLGYLMERYDEFLKDPSSIDEELRKLFNEWGAPPRDFFTPKSISQEADQKVSDLPVDKVILAVQLVNHIRTYGHLAANINPLKIQPASRVQWIEPETYGLSEDDLRRIPARVIWEYAPDHISNAWDAITHLKKAYTNGLAFQFSHVSDMEERKWLNRIAESNELYEGFNAEEKKNILNRLGEVEGFERFLHKTFVGQKRFSLEGLDILVPMLDLLIKKSAEDGIRHIKMGMAHRGRLNVLAHILGKPLETIFSEFHESPNKKMVPSEGSIGINYGWTGDVKYHLGGDRTLKAEEEVLAYLTLANNPSHLEFVNPVVEGMTRADQEERNERGFPKLDASRALAILIHGDAAFPGEGVVAETLNLSRLEGYAVGGAVHIVANNQLGFTTSTHQSRATPYASDLAKGFEIPIVHVNADIPEDCFAAIQLAHLYSKKFNKDFVIDLIGYRRHGHNEMDDPVATQPKMYEKIKQHPTVFEQFAEQMQKEKLITAAELDELLRENEQRFNDALDQMKLKSSMANTKPVSSSHLLQPPVEVLDIKTAVDLNQLRELNKELINFPEAFKVYPKLKTILERRSHALDEGGRVDWAHAEALAFASILSEGTSIRMTGQDVERGTFAHRHLMLHDVNTGDRYSPLHQMPQAKASFSLYNSPLTEAAVVGFEYGYDIASRDCLVIWEAQFGDFVNVAQTIIDQFLSSGRAKWGQASSLVMLLPHAYEGQGPEHSNARLERFLIASAENNWTVANVTRASQYFHLLRQQAALVNDKEARPLVLMSPKSLLRHKKSPSMPAEFSEGKFMRVFEPMASADMGPNTKVETLLLCSGKIGVELEEALEKQLENNEGNPKSIRLLQLEQLYPFPLDELKQIRKKYKNVKNVIWVQEEPKNMGSWYYVAPRLQDWIGDQVKVQYVGRPDRSSPATGYPNVHQQEQKAIIHEALNYGTI